MSVEIEKRARRWKAVAKQYRLIDVRHRSTVGRGITIDIGPDDFVLEGLYFGLSERLPLIRALLTDEERGHIEKAIELIAMEYEGTRGYHNVERPVIATLRGLLGDE